MCRAAREFYQAEHGAVRVSWPQSFSANFPSAQEKRYGVNASFIAGSCAQYFGFEETFFYDPKAAVSGYMSVASSIFSSVWWSQLELVCIIPDHSWASSPSSRICGIIGLRVALSVSETSRKMTEVRIFCSDSINEFDVRACAAIQLSRSKLAIRQRNLWKTTNVIRNHNPVNNYLSYHPF